MPTLSLNFSPVSLAGQTIINVGCQPYEQEVLINLRKKYGGSHVFKRNYHDNTIINIPVLSGEKPIGDEIIEIDLSEEYRFWSPLLEAALIRLFSGRRDIISDYPVQILGNSQQNFIQHNELPSWVQQRMLLEFQPRTLFSTEDKPIFGLLCNVRLRNLLLGSCAELIKRGLDLKGRYVLVENEAYDSRVLPRAQLVGRVNEVNGDDLFLEDFRPGFEIVKASQARLSGNIVDFDWCVHQLLGASAKHVLDEAKSHANWLHSGKGRLGYINKALKFLSDKGLEAVPGVNFLFDDFLNSKFHKAIFPTTEMIKKPDLVFDPSGSRTDTWNERGIKNNGPYDQRTFTPKRLNVVVICQARFEGKVDAFVAKFLDGMPDVKTGRGNREQARYGDGFLRRFSLEKPNVQTFTSINPTFKAYEDACKKALQQSADSGIPWDLALVQIEEGFKKLPGNQNPYYGTKALLLKNHVAVQSIRLETMSQPDKSLVFSMNQMSLASYAKLGGRPWLLGTEQTNCHELVIGIGSHVANDSKFGSGKRHVGITTVFSSDGSYHLSERTGVVPFEEYTDALTETLKKTISRIREEDNWRNSDRVRLIFHMFKPAKDIEAESIKTAVEGLNLDNVTYAFVHIAPQHPFLIFDHKQKGQPSYAKEKKGELGPSRGLRLKLSENQALVVFSGVSELKQVTDGIPRPCLLTLHRNSTFRDMTYLATQAFDFSAHSWRIMGPEPFPITIKYSDQIAERLTGLKQIEDWDDDAIKFREIGRTPWFL